MFSSIACFSQVINVNTTTYTVPQLVRDILVNKPCVPVNNITWRTGTNFGSTNGIGYFTNTNLAFPLTSGVILSTGNVTNAPGPNTTQLDDGNATWTGDTDLENTLLAAGITMNSTNATVLEFDFTPFSSNFNFQFLFASEEYGNFQCQFSDAFAFLLTNTSTGVTTNLAVVPGTTTPISVVTIRDFLYNSSCPSANSSFFSAFNGGSAAAGSATNFNGQTVVLSAASSTLVPNVTYHIKLVIADRGDNQADSAIFLASNSFNVGQDVLGQDLTIASNTAICENELYTIQSGLDPAIYSFEWTLNGNPIGGNTPDLIINQPGNYGLTYTIISSNCVVTTDFKNIEYFNAISTPDPSDLFLCNTSQATYTFDLSLNTPILSPSGEQISYHATLADANGSTNALPNNYSVPASNLPTTIFARIVNPNTNCFIVKSFRLELTPPPVANNPGDITQCESITGSGNSNFILSNLDATVLGSQSPSIYGVSYHNSASDATSGTNPIPSNGFSTGNTTIFIRVQNNTDTTCFDTTSINLIVRPRPALDPIPNQFVCVSYTLPTLVNGGNYYSGPNQGLPMLNASDVITVDSTIYIYNETGGTPNCNAERSFRVEIVLREDITPADVTACDQYVLPALAFNSRYFTQPGGPSGGGTELFAGSVIITPGNTTIYVYFVSTESPPCIISSSFVVTINVTPTITGSFPNLFDCIAVTSLPTLAVGNYYTYDASTNTYSPVVLPIITTTVIYVFATNGTCRTPDTIFTVYIGSLGLQNVNECNSYNLQPAPVGEYRTQPNGGGTIIPPSIITQSIRVYTYVPNAGPPNCTDDDFFDITINGSFLSTPSPVVTCGSFILPVQPENGRYFTLTGGPASSGNVELFPSDIITTSTTIYIYKASTTQAGCFTEIPWQITINQRPIIDSRANVEQCDSYTLTPLMNGNYYDNTGGVNPLSAGTVITTNNRIYIYAANPNDANCNSENFFDISINGVSTDPAPTQLVWCDSFTFPPLPTPGNFYYTETGGPNGTGSIIPAGTVVNSTTVAPIYYIYYETGDRLNCSDETSFSITINNTPIITPAIASVINVCNSYTLPTLTVGQYFTQPNGAGTIVDPAIPLTALQTTVYAYAETATTPNCFTNQAIQINIFNVEEPQSVTRCASYILPNLPAGQRYYTQPNGVGLVNNTTINSTQTLYVYGLSGYNPNCSDEHSFTVTIVPTPVADTVTPLTNCDTFGDNDGIFQYDLTSLAIRNDVLNGATPDSDFILSFFTSFADATNPLAVPISNPSTYVNDNPFNDSVWIRVTNNTLTDPCFDVEELILRIVARPNPTLEPEYYICNDYATGTLLNPVLLDTNLSGANLVFAWTFNGTPTGGNTSTLLVDEPGTYTVTVTNTTTTCISDTISTSVVTYAPYIEVTYSDAFADQQFITVNVLGAGSGNYEYQLDDSNFQDSNQFFNVIPGTHIINVRDKNGNCSPAPSTAIIINYPKFFTPNGDGYHDTWNILNLKTTNPDAPIYIFDRYGKFLKQISPSINGWDGTYNGEPLPSTDYWFTVEFNEKGTTKIFKSHFSLKR